MTAVVAILALALWVGCEVFVGTAYLPALAFKDPHEAEDLHKDEIL